MYKLVVVVFPILLRLDCYDIVSLFGLHVCYYQVTAAMQQYVCEYFVFALVNWIVVEHCSTQSGP